METTTFIEKFKKNGHVFETEITVERTPGNLGELRMTRGRYFDYIGDSITSANNVKVTFKTSGGTTWTDEYTEIVTPSGRGCVIAFQSGSELMSFIPNSGKALITGCWKKYGSYRGHAVGYFRGNNLNPNSRARVYHTCCAHLYDAAVGGTKYQAA